MAIINTVIREIGNNRIEGSFSSDGVALPNTTGTIAAPVAPAVGPVITVATVDPFTVGDVINVPGIGPAGAALVCGISSIPTSTTINIQGTRVTTAMTGQTITVLPFLFVKHNVKRITLRNLTNGTSAEWNESMGYGSAWKVDASGNQASTTTDGFYVRGSIVYLHPTLYAINSNYTFSMDY